VHKQLVPYYSHTGRLSIDPALMIRMLIVGYVFAIRSERQPSRTTYPIIRGSGAARAISQQRRPTSGFEGVVAMCIAAGLVSGEAFSVDASLIKADVDKKKRVPGDQPIA